MCICTICAGEGAWAMEDSEAEEEDAEGGGVWRTSESTMERGVPGLLGMGTGVPAPEAEPLLLLLVLLVSITTSSVTPAELL